MSEGKTDSAAKDFVFLHGGGQGSWIWDETVAAMRQQSAGRDFRVILLDVPGCGTKRGRDTAGIDLPDVVKELAAELSASNVKDAIIVGHSQAGTVLPGLLAAHPEMFRRAVYVSCSAPTTGQTVSGMMGIERHGVSPDHVGWPRSLSEMTIPEQLPLMFCNDMAAEDQLPFMTKLGKDVWPDACGREFTDWHYVTGPAKVTYVVALQDNILPVEWQLKFAERFGADRITKIDAGHQVMNTRPQALAEVLFAEAKV